MAYGFRAPNGVCLNPDGSFTTSDQEGHYTPANRINWVKPGGFYGYMWTNHKGEPPKSYDPPICWMHPSVDRSPAAQFWVPKSSWGTLGGKLMSISYGTGFLYHVLHEEVDGKVQGGVVKLPLGAFATGSMRTRNHADGNVYICGLFGWSSNRTRPGGFYRVRRTEKPMHLPTALHATTKGIVLEFSDPVDARRAGDARRYSMERWNYLYRQNYGSKDYKLSDGSIGRDKVTAASAKVSADGRKVFLAIDDMKPCMQMSIKLRIAGKDGARVGHEIFHTIHALGDPGPHLAAFE